ncbi:unnamed protein product [Schistosoma spindalis]|nr:unnamed protein product [Schistosoma spindale]
MLNNDIILRIQTIYSNSTYSNEWIKSSYILLNDIIHYYNVNYFTLYTISILGRFLSYIIQTIGTIDYINIKCIETLHYLFTNQFISMKLKTSLIHLIEIDLATNLLNKQFNINHYTWNCICDYIINCNNIAPIIRILIYVCIKTIIYPIEYKQCLIKLKHFITMTTKYPLDFYELIMIFKLLNDQSKVYNSRITSFCFNIMQLLYYNIKDSDYYNAMNYYIQSERDNNNNNNSSNGDLSQVNFIPHHHHHHQSNIGNYGNTSDDIYTDHANQLNDSNNTSQVIILIPNYIYSLLCNQNDYVIQLKGIKALQLFTWKMYCHKKSFQYYPNLLCYIKNIRIFLTNILNIMYHQSINIIVHLIDIVLMLLHHLPNYVIQSNIKEIFHLFKPILINNLKTMYYVIHRMLLQLLNYFTVDIILDELWLYYNHRNFRIRTNTIYCITYILHNRMEQNIDIMKMIKRIVQCLKDKSGVVQSAAAKCCATLVTISNNNNNISILSIIENLLLNDMSMIEVNFLLEKIKKYINLKNDEDLVAMVNYENDFKQNYNRGNHHLDCRSDTIDKSISRNTSERFNMPINHLDLNKMDHLNGSYFQMSERRKRLKSSKSDNQKSVRRYIDTMKLHEFSAQTQSQLDHRKDVKDHPNTQEIYDEPTTINAMPDLQDTLTGEEINCPINWYNQGTENQINRGLESLRNSVSRRRKQWLFNQMAKINTKKLSESNHDNLYQMKPLNIENQDYPLYTNSNMWTSQDNDNYLITSNHEKHLLPTYEYCEKLSNQWRTNTSYSLNPHSYKQSKYSVNNRMYKSMNDIHSHVNKEQSKMEYNANKNQEKQSISTQKKSKYSTTTTSSSYNERIKNDSHVIKKTIDHSKECNKPIGIEEQILEYITSKNWEEQIKATDMIENLLETMNVKPLEILFSDSKNINKLVCGIEQTVKCLRSQVSLKGLKTIEQLCHYLNAIHQGHLLNPYAEPLITTLLSRISEDSSTKFIQKQSYQSLEILISCIDNMITIHILCTILWEKFIQSNIKRNTISQLLNYILCNQLNNSKKNMLLFQRLGLYGLNQLMKVVKQLINDKVSSTRLNGRRILEQINLFTDINRVYKQDTINDNSLELEYIKSKNLKFRR